MAVVSILEYDVGNILSVRRAIEAVGAEAKLITSPEEIAASERLLLPGVGAFGDCIGALRKRGLIDAIRAFAASGRPMLGVCVGMQMLFERSFEFGEHEGLGLLAGVVDILPNTTIDGAPLRRPHIGWSPLRPGAGAPNDEASPLGPQAMGRPFYFVHSYAAKPADAETVLATVDVGGHEVVAAVGRDALFGVQFHPEKSARDGLAMIQRFVAL